MRKRWGTWAKSFWPPPGARASARVNFSSIHHVNPLSTYMPLNSTHQASMAVKAEPYCWPFPGSQLEPKNTALIIIDMQVSEQTSRTAKAVTSAAFGSWVGPAAAGCGKLPCPAALLPPLINPLTPSLLHLCRLTSAARCEPQGCLWQLHRHCKPQQGAACNGTRAFFAHFPLCSAQQGGYVDQMGYDTAALAAPIQPIKCVLPQPSCISPPSRPASACHEQAPGPTLAPCSWAPF